MDNKMDPVKPLSPWAPWIGEFNFWILLLSGDEVITGWTPGVLGGITCGIITLRLYVIF